MSFFLNFYNFGDIRANSNKLCSPIDDSCFNLNKCVWVFSSKKNLIVIKMCVIVKIIFNGLNTLYRLKIALFYVLICKIIP